MATTKIKIEEMTTWPLVEIKRTVRKDKKTRMAYLKCGDTRSIDNTARTHVRCRPCAVRTLAKGGKAKSKKAA